MKYWYNFGIILWFSCVNAAFIYETSYRPHSWHFTEPRVECDWLNTWELTWLGGSTTSAYNGKKAKLSLCNFINHCSPTTPAVSHFRLFDLQLDWVQNFKYGFYIGVMALPLRSLQLSQGSRTREEINHPGDTRGYLGWTINYIDTQWLDFVDFSIMLGALFPTSNSISVHQIIPISTGFNHHWGGTANMAFSLGFFDWVTWGIWGEGLFFAEKAFTYSPGTVWDIGTYLKADHVIKGLSLVLGYSFEQKRADRAPLACHLCCAQAQTDRHVLHLMCEWDGQTIRHPHRPRIQLIYNHTCAGKNIVNTSTLGGLLGFDIAWCW